MWFVQIHQGFSDVLNSPQRYWGVKSKNKSTKFVLKGLETMFLSLQECYNEDPHSTLDIFGFFLLPLTILYNSSKS